MTEISMRSFIADLEAVGDLHRVEAEVDWNLEIAGISRVNLGQEGPALLFENIKGYSDSYCSRMLTCAIGKYSQAALAIGLPADSSPQEIIAKMRQCYRNPIAPEIVETGPVKDNILTGDDINLHDLPVPMFNYQDGGRYIDTFSCTITKDPDTGHRNIGIYRGMVLDKDKIAKNIGKTQGWGQHFVKHGLKPEPMPVAVVYGWHEVLSLVGGTSFNRTVSEFDMAGALLGEPMKMVKCETIDLEVPATAELVIEGLIDPNPETFELEGPFAEYHGFQGGAPGLKPVMKVTAITYRNKPIFRAGMEGCRPGFPSEDLGIHNTSLIAVLMNSMEDVGVLGVTDIHLTPVTSGAHVIVQINKLYRGQAQQVASALWSRNYGLFVFKHVVVVEQDIDIRDPEAVDWAIAYRVDAGQGGLTTFKCAGSPMDPAVNPIIRNPKKYGAGQWTRMLIDATRDWDFDLEQPGGQPRFQQVYRLPIDLEQQICERWQEYGISPEYVSEARREVLTLEKTMKLIPDI
ncbi:MAG: UbiD family decarboxylase [Halioglobus sp.]